MGVVANLVPGSVTVQAGGQNGDFAAYFAADALNDKGWRDYSPSRLRRIFADLGTRGDGGEFHLSFTGADNFIFMLGNSYFWGAARVTLLYLVLSTCLMILLAMGLAPGPRVGRVLRAVETARLEGEIATREEALARARALAGGDSAP